MDQYLIDVSSQDREKEAVRQFCATPFMLDELLSALGVPPGFHWVLLEMPHSRLAEGRVGDIDLLAGPLAWTDPAAIELLVVKSREVHPGEPEWLHRYCAALELAGKGGLMWPPPLDYLVAVEAKCAYFDGDRQRVMSQKGSKSSIRNVRLQLDELIEVIPFNRVALLDLIVNPPASGVDGQAWFTAGNVAMTSFRLFLPEHLPEATSRSRDGSLHRPPDELPSPEAALDPLGQRSSRYRARLTSTSTAASSAATVHRALGALNASA